MKDFSVQIGEETLEYFDSEHIYLVDGICVPSITQLLMPRFGHKYDNVPKKALEQAAARGTQIHDAVEKLVKTGEMEQIEEIRNILFLSRAFSFDFIDAEIPVILHRDEVPIAAGRMDLILTIGESCGIADVKTTSTLDKDYLFYQLNLYRLAYMQSYDQEIGFLAGIHLRGSTRKFVQIPIDEDAAMRYLEETL